MNSASKVGEIFAAAGSAFTKLGELTMQLHPANENAAGTKWTEEEIEMLRSCISKFGGELNLICERIKSRTVSQIRTALKKKAFEDAGLALPPSSTPTNSMGIQSPPLGGPVSMNAQKPSQRAKAISSMKSSEVTLNMLNASDGDVENLTPRLDFDASAVVSS